MKPMLAVDAVYDKIKYPIMIFPKIDGVRGLIVDGQLVGRSGKQFKNKLNTKMFSDTALNGLDGEMVVSDLTGDTICRDTTSALMTIEGEVQTRLCVFDYIVEDINDETPYLERYNMLPDRIRNIQCNMKYWDKFWIIPYVLVYDKNELMIEVEKNLTEGYEGSILRDPKAPYKHGRSTANEASYLRVKPFMDTEIVISHVIEGQSNNNELKENPHGQAERSTHKENMIPNGMVGTVCGHAMEDIEFNGKLVIRKGQEIEVGAGKLSHDERKFYFDNQNKIIGRIAKFQFFPIGIKDKPRFPTFQSFRSATDM